jgi:hypothetical protein
MPAYVFVGDWQEAAIGAVRAFDPWLFTNAANPFIRARRRAPGFSCPLIFESAGINVFPAAKKRAE